MVKTCKECQLVRRTRSIRSNAEDMKSIHVCGLFYIIDFDITRPLPKTNQSNKYILVAIDHYSKWCEAKVVNDHIIIMVAKFLKEDIICTYGVPKIILINNGRERFAKFDNLCNN